MAEPPRSQRSATTRPRPGPIASESQQAALRPGAVELVESLSAHFNVLLWSGAAESALDCVAGLPPLLRPLVSPGAALAPAPGGTPASLATAAALSDAAGTAESEGHPCPVAGLLGSALAVTATTRKFGTATVRPLALALAVVRPGLLDRIGDAVHVTSTARNTALDGKCGLLVKPFRPESDLELETDSELRQLASYFQVLARFSTFAGARHKRWRHVGKLAAVDDSEARWMAGLAPTAPAHAQYVTHVHHGHSHGHSHHEHEHDGDGRDSNMGHAGAEGHEHGDDSESHNPQD